MILFYIGEKNLLRLKGLYDPAGAGGYVTTETLTFQFYESDGVTAVANGGGTLTYVASSPHGLGVYEGKTNAAIDITLDDEGKNYRCRLTDADDDVERWVDFVAVRRGET